MGTKGDKNKPICPHFVPFFVPFERPMYRKEQRGQKCQILGIFRTNVCFRPMYRKEQGTDTRQNFVPDFVPSERPMYRQNRNFVPAPFWNKRGF